ncbi:MAG: hypothetical protein P8K08_26305 [Fuerstiella sp.]|jgi:hypothetical protein|nr:hypothetical protein [Fuerstiella sp.]
MSNAMKNNLFPVLSVIAGASVTMLCAGWVERLDSPDSALRASINKFDQLEPRQQQRLLTQAAGFESRDSEYKERIISVHDAVSADPSLESKLRMLHDWWRPMDATQEAKIRSYEGDPAEWVHKVQQAYVASHASRNVIVIGIRGLREPSRPQGEWLAVDLTEQQFESLLNSLVPMKVPPELNSKLNGFNPNDSCEITLTKIVWVLRQVRNSFGLLGRPDLSGHPPATGRPPQPAVPNFPVFDLVQIADVQSYFDTAEWELLSQTFFKTRNDAEPVGDEDTRRRKAFLLGKCVGDGLRHYSRVFREKHLGDRNGDLRTLFENDDNLVNVFEDGDRGMQLDLMTMDPGRAADSLKMERLKTERERLSAEDAEDSAIAGLINDLTDLQRGWSFGGRGGMGRGSSFGSRGGFGRPDRDDNRGSRNRDDGRGEGRSGGGRPSRDGRLEFR